jgi:hypothetical protein
LKKNVARKANAQKKVSFRTNVLVLLKENPFAPEEGTKVWKDSGK